jgi:hypothetical protein
MKKSAAAQLEAAYKKKIKKLSSDLNKDTGMSLFVNHLKYIRDSVVIKPQIDLEQEPVKTTLATLMAAIAEFEASKRAADTQQKNFHWNTFCDFVKFNMEEWLILYDSI